MTRIGAGPCATGAWQLDPYHTQVEFSANHLGMMRARGHVADVGSTTDLHPDRPERSSIEATIQTGSVRTHHEAPTNDLRSSNLLEVDTYPTMTFKSTGIQVTDAEHFTPTGGLTIKGITHPPKPDDPACLAIPRWTNARSRRDHMGHLLDHVRHRAL